MIKKMQFRNLIIFTCLFMLIYVYHVSNYLQTKFFNELIEKKSRKLLFCMILTTPSNFKTKTLAVNNTWAKECDKYFFITKMMNNSLPVNVSYEFTDPFPILQPAYHYNETYQKLTDKVFKTFLDVYLRYNDYDFYLKCDDDTFIFVDNLRDFLKTKNKSEPVTYGHDFKMNADRVYHSGGAGYVLSNEALKRIGDKLVLNYTFCERTGVEDIDVAKCLRKLNVYAGSSLDDFGRERFHPFDLNTHLLGQYSAWYHLNAANPIKKGTECCSDTSISFHYMTPKKIEQLYSLWSNLKTNSSKPYNISSILYQMVNHD